MHEPGVVFATDYRSARERFLLAARDAGARLASLPHTGRGPAGEALVTDVATLGDDDAPALMLVTSGLHGVEGAVGSAVQSAWLGGQAGKPLPAGLRVVVVHALNPWGFAHGRRTDTANVDLNRNFLLPGERHAGAPPELAALGRLVAPRSPPRPEPFRLRALALVASRGMAALRRVLTAGQYEHPQGLFYGGREAAPATRLVQAHADRWLGAAQRVLHLDLHSGLGRHGGALLLAMCEPGSAGSEWLQHNLSRAVTAAEGAPEGTGADWHGTFGRWLALVHGGGRERWLHATLEFGTLGPIAMYAALRAENRAWWQSAAALPAARRRLCDSFAPPSAPWRRGVTRLGAELLERAAARWH